MSTERDAGDLLRELAPQVLGTLARRWGDFDAAEDAVQEALIAAARHWSADGIPAQPRGWLLQTASRRMVDQWRSDTARRDREVRVATEPGTGPTTEVDDTLTVLFLCCHPVLSPTSAVALTLRAVGGPVPRRSDQRLLHRVLRGVEVAPPARERAEDLRRQLAQQVLDLAGDVQRGLLAVSR